MSEILRRQAENFRTPTDAQIIERFKSHGIVDIVGVPCSITDTIWNEWEKQQEKGEVNLHTMNAEQNIPGVAAGIHLGSGRLALQHMQNSGLPAASEGYISFLRPYRIRALALVTWRGSNKDDDSEPHQEIGAITDGLTTTTFPEVYGDRTLHRNVLHEIDRAVVAARNGETQSVVRLSPNAFRKELSTHLSSKTAVYDLEKRKEQKERAAYIAATKGTDSSPISSDRVYEPEEALHLILKQHPDAAMVFANGYNARRGQSTPGIDRKLNLYNAGMMGGATAIGYGIAVSNPDIEVVVAEGDQGNLMNHMLPVLNKNYPRNLFVYVLDNQIGESVGTAQSLPPTDTHYNYARYIPTRPLAEGKKFPYPRVGLYTLDAHGNKILGAHYQSEEAQEMLRTQRYGESPLPVHARMFAQAIQEQTAINRALRGE